MAMHTETSHRWQHRHAFGTHERQAGERRTWWVIALTAAMMTVEVAAGMVFGSMALLADGWHMGTHAAALGIAVFAYVYARRNADNPKYSFGTGKVGALGGFASAVGLAVVALLVFIESVVRVVSPTTIRFDEAIGVAVIGLVVNIVSALILRGGREHTHGHAEHDHTHYEHHDHNLRGAYLHVIADAMTSVLAIVALIAGKVLGWSWMDPAMGMVGALVIARWSYGLLRDTSRVLLDAEADTERRSAVRAAIEADAGCRVADLHIWRVGPSHLAAILSVVSRTPHSPDHYKELLAGDRDLVHVTVEVYECAGEDLSSPAS
jgi:cation diffusion facilitator family transporter